MANNSTAYNYADGDLKSCPFCGSPDAIMLCDDGYFYVRCDSGTDCRAETGRYMTNTQAVDAWNTREPQWTTVTPETMPPVHGNNRVCVLICTDTGDVMSAWYYLAQSSIPEHFEHENTWPFRNEAVTHWMPLPEPPKEYDIVPISERDAQRTA